MITLGLIGGQCGKAIEAVFSHPQFVAETNRGLFMIRIYADGHDDVIVGAPDAQGNGKDCSGTAYVHSGKNGEVLYLWHGLKNFDHFGSAVCGAGNVNQDGVDDFLVGSPGYDSFPYSDNGTVGLDSGPDGILNPNAEASASIGVAAGSANSLVGHTFWLAAVSNSAGLVPEFSSITVAITID